MSFSVNALVRRALAITTAGLLALSTVPVAAADSLDELMELNTRAWSGEPELLSEVYAPDGVHTATFYDHTNEYTGPEGIAQVASGGVMELIGPNIDIPSALDNEWRWVDFVSIAGGTACLWRAVDGLIVRHDCILPENSYDNQPRAGLADAATSARIDEVVARLEGTWGTNATVEGLTEVYAPDAVHTARFDSWTSSYAGPEEIISVARVNSTMEPIGPRVDFEAQGDELAWASVSSLGGGTVCIFRAVDGMVIRHDCLLPK